MDGIILTDKTKKLIISMVLDFGFIKGWMRPFAKPLLKIALKFINKKGDQFIPDNLDPLINESIQAAFNGNLKLASIKCGTALNMVADIPLLDEDSEQEFFVDAVTFIIKMIKRWIEKKK